MGRIPIVETVIIHLVRLPLVRPFGTSFSVQTQREALLLEVRAGGISGWGECVASPEPYYGYETNLTARHILKDFLIPALWEMRDFTSAEALLPMRRVRGHAMAKAALENALLDLQARLAGVPLYVLLGGLPRKIMSGISIGLQDDPGNLARSIQAALDRKYHRIKIKIKRDRDVAVVGAVRAVFPTIPLMADANSDYTLADLPLLRQLDRFGLMMLEQPLGHDDLFQHAKLQRELRTPICLDESIKSRDDAEAALAMGSGRIINIKQGRVGGLLEAAAIQRVCLESGVPVWSGGMLETGIGRAFNIHLQTLPGFTLPGDTSETARYFDEDIADPPVVLDADGFIGIPPGAGTGMTIHPGRFRRYSIFREELSPA